MAIKKWSDVRERHIEAVGAEVVTAQSSQMLARVRAHTLSDVRRRKGLTQKQVAQAAGWDKPGLAGAGPTCGLLPHLELFVAECGHEAELPAQRLDIPIQDVEPREIAMLDLGDPADAHAHGRRMGRGIGQQDPASCQHRRRSLGNPANGSRRIRSVAPCPGSSIR